MSKEEIKIHQTAEVSKLAKIGEGTSIWNQAQVREEVKLGKNCVISKNAYLDKGVRIGNNVKIQNNVSVYFPARIGDGVFVGPHVCFTNDKIPRAINSDGSPKIITDWNPLGVWIKKGASIGAHSVLLPGIKIGKFAMVGAGSVVSRDVPDYTLVYGNPARMVGFVCACGHKLSIVEKMERAAVHLKCDCGQVVKIAKRCYRKVVK